MTDSQPDNAPSSPVEQPFSAGAALREARVRLGLSVGDVAHRLKFAPRQVEALEADDFARLPEITFVRGFVRSYARLLQLDPAPLLAALPGSPAPPPPLATHALKEVPFPSGASETRKPNLIWLAAAALIVAMAAGFYIWSHSSKPGTPKAPKTTSAVHEQAMPAPASPPASAVPVLPPPAPVPATPPPAAAALPAPQIAAPAPQSGVAATPKRPGILRMEFDEESWLEVRDRDDRILLSRVFPRGSEQSLNGKAPFTLVIGRGSAVRLTYKGKPVDLAPYTKAEVTRLTLE